MAYISDSDTTVQEPSDDFILFAGSEEFLSTPVFDITLGVDDTECGFGAPLFGPEFCDLLTTDWAPLEQYSSTFQLYPSLWAPSDGSQDGLTPCFQPDFSSPEGSVLSDESSLALSPSSGFQVSPSPRSLEVMFGDNFTSLPPTGFDFGQGWADQFCVSYGDEPYNLPYNPDPLLLVGSECHLSPATSTPGISSSSESDSSSRASTRSVSRSPENNTYSCDHCARLCKTHKELNQHKRCHSKRYRCRNESCRKRGIGFGTRRDLERHETAVHVGEKKECPHCGKKIKRHDNLVRHIAKLHKKSE